MALVPEIKLIRTDTTLDLSQKAEKVWKTVRGPCVYIEHKSSFFARLEFGGATEGPIRLTHSSSLSKAPWLKSSRGRVDLNQWVCLVYTYENFLEPRWYFHFSTSSFWTLQNNWHFMELREVLKTVHSCQFLFKSLGRNARKCFASFQIELSAPIFKKGTRKIQNFLTKSLIFENAPKKSQNIQNHWFCQRFLDFPDTYFENPRRQFDFKWPKRLSRVSPKWFGQKLTAVDSFEHFSKFKFWPFSPGFDPAPS